MYNMCVKICVNIIYKICNVYIFIVLKGKAKKGKALLFYNGNS